jgi:hypothetical protein
MGCNVGAARGTKLRNHLRASRVVGHRRVNGGRAGLTPARPKNTRAPQPRGPDVARRGARRAGGRVGCRATCVLHDGAAFSIRACSAGARAQHMQSQVVRRSATHTLAPAAIRDLRDKSWDMKSLDQKPSTTW